MAHDGSPDEALLEVQSPKVSWKAKTIAMNEKTKYNPKTA
jgi:hypothetical protein